MLEINFEYRDTLSHNNWSKQVCVVSSLDECLSIYGLEKDPNCEYKILSIYDLNNERYLYVREQVNSHLDNSKNYIKLKRD